MTRSSSAKRILIPVFAAAICAAGILLLLWWQLVHTQTGILKNTAGQTANQDLLQATLPLSVTSADVSGDAALLHIRRGDIYLLQGELKVAQNEYQLAIDAGAGLPALRKLAQVQLQRHDLDAIQKTIDALRREGARSEDLLLLQSIVLLQRAELQQVQTLLSAAADSPQKHYGQALLNIVQGNHDQAKEELALVQNGWEPVLRSYAHTLQNAYDEYALFPDSPVIHRTTLLARALADVQQCELSLPLLAQVTAQQDDYRDAWMVQGFCELITERNKEALSSLERAYSLDPQKPEIQYFLARTYSALQDHSNAITFAQYALRNGFTPEYDVRLLLGKEAALAGDATTSLAQFDALSKLPDATVDSYATYVKTAISMAKTDDAYLKALAATQKWPQDANAYDLLGTAALAVKKSDEAKAAFTKALEINPILQHAKTELENLK